VTPFRLLDRLRRAIALFAFRRGLRAIERHPSRALVFGAIARALQFSGGFEVLGRARRARGELALARGVLEEGVRVAPSAWILWSLLASTLCDLDERERAESAFRRALTCPAVNEAEVRYNLAVTLSRDKRTDAALAEFALAETLGFGAGATCARLQLLNDAGRFDEVLAGAVVDDDGVNAQIARAYWEGRGDRVRALEHIDHIIERGELVEAALAVLRDIGGTKTPGAKWFRVIVRGPWLPGDWAGFVRVVDVVADGPDKALEHAKRIEPQSIRATLGAHSVNAGDAAPERLHGAYSASGRIFYEE
jgi:tetratricopeptide (TPR) repeat protein